MLHAAASPEILLIIGDGMSFFCRPLWDCYVCLGAIKLNYQLIRRWPFLPVLLLLLSWKRTDLRHHIQLFNRHLYTLLNLPQQLPVAPYAAVEHTQARTQSRLQRIINTRPIQPCQVIIAVITSPLPIEQPPAILAPKPISTPPNPLRNVVCASAARTRNSRLALAAINDREDP